MLTKSPTAMPLASKLALKPAADMTLLKTDLARELGSLSGTAFSLPSFSETPLFVPSPAYSPHPVDGWAPMPRQAFQVMFVDESAAMIADAGVLPSAGVAGKALANLYGAIVYEDGADMKNDLIAFYDVIGQEQPADAFYYEK